MRLSRKLALVLGSLLASSAIALYEAQSIPSMTTATKAFLASLTPKQYDKATFDFEDKERLNWHFIPRERKGLPIKEMEAFQRQLAQAMLITGLSQTGYIKASTIMSLEKVLFDQENGRRIRDEELYFFSVFGDPSNTGSWGWRFEGHHLALNFTINGGQIAATTPAFFGANPAEIRVGPRKGLRPLGNEEDFARELYNALRKDQKEIAKIGSEAPRDIIMGPARNERLGNEGLKFPEMNDSQKRMLIKLIREYTDNMSSFDAKSAMEGIRDGGLENIYFAWAGSSLKGEAHYYRIQGPTFIAEYDNIQNNANHIHSVWRDLRDDFGIDLIAEHYRSAHNHRGE